MTRWTATQANAWYAQQPWPLGCNFIPSNAINQLEMWQAATFDPATIDRELGWAAFLGFDPMRNTPNKESQREHQSTYKFEDLH
ncbi:hypothetical protein LCGC14_1213170 [marine sediment metagenome]|uniref:Uncharacterized protein n=1 Tax=marine sediment metagenome TaxID=412755 RepID=A0A0F9LHM3_9ZZZZ